MAANEVYPILVGAEQIITECRVTTTNPYTKAPIGDVCQATPTDLEAAMAKACSAFETTRKYAAYERAEPLAIAAELIQEREDDLARTIVEEVGKPIRFARDEVKRSVLTFTAAAEEAKRIGGDVVPIDVSAASRHRVAFTRRFPIGVVACITPFNFPVNLAAHKVAPALAAGCTAVLKPPPQAPITALKLGSILVKAGVYPGAISVLPMGNDLAQKLVTDRRTAMLSFTGSAAVGWRLKGLIPEKRVILEMGGNAAAIVHGDADLAYAVPRLAMGEFAYAGQVCISVQRILVQQSVYRTFAEKFMEETEAKIVVGDPMDGATVVGPMIDQKACLRILEWIDEAKAKGAQVEMFGVPASNVIPPTVILNAPANLPVVCEEAFAPVVVIAPYDDFDDALAYVNDSVYGLQAGVFTRDINLIMRAHEELRVGTVVANDYPTFRADPMPYGGVKMSGYGREGVRYAIEQMTDERLLVVNLR